MTKATQHTPKALQLTEIPLGVGESPIWDDRDQSLWFVDILAPAVFWRSADGSIRRFDMPAPVGCIALSECGLIVLGLQTGVHLLDPVTGRIDFLCNPDGGRADSRLNDGKVGPDGHLWVGTRDEAVPQTGNGRLYRVAPDGSFTTVLEGLLTSNGLAWSPDGTRMYHSDSSGLYVQACDFDPATGALGPWQRLHDNTPEEGRPDGAAIDSEGFYWSCGVRSGRINRMSPEGEYVEIWHMPVKGCAMPCFGGPDLKTLYLTSLTLTEGDTTTPGSLHAFQVPVSGAPVTRFAL